MKTVCIMCPVGCEITITQNGKNVEVTGNTCVRGLEYGKSEISKPMRMVTALINTKKGVLPVKTTNLVPKSKISNVLKEIAKINIPSAKAGDIVIKNVCKLGVDVIVTGNY